MVQRIVCVRRPMHPGHPQTQLVILGEGALAHQRQGHRNVRAVRQRHQLPLGIGIVQPSSPVDQRALRSIQHLRRALDHLRMPHHDRPIPRQFHCFWIVEIQLPLLHVSR